MFGSQSASLPNFFVYMLYILLLRKDNPSKHTFQNKAVFLLSEESCSNLLLYAFLPKVDIFQHSCSALVVMIQLREFHVHPALELLQMQVTYAVNECKLNVWIKEITHISRQDDLGPS